MISPSIFSRTRRTPWVLGCWGPMFSSIHSLAGSCAGSRSLRTSGFTVAGSATDCVGLQSLELLVAKPNRSPDGDVTLAEAWPFPGSGHQYPAQVRGPLDGSPRPVKGCTLI